MTRIRQVTLLAMLVVPVGASVDVFAGFAAPSLPPMVEATIAVPVARIDMSAGRDAGAAIDEIRNLVYMPEREIFAEAGTPVRGQLLVLDGTTDAVVDRISLWKDGSEVLALAVAVDTAANRVYVTSDEAAGLWVLDATTRQLVELVELPHRARTVAVNPTTGLIYVRVLEDRVIIVVNPRAPLGTAGRVTLIRVETEGTRVEVNPITNLVYVGDAGGSSAHTPLVVIDGDPARGTFHTILATLPIYSESSAFAVNQRTGLVYVLGWNGHVDDGGLAHVMVVNGDPSHPTFHTIVEDIALDLSLAGQGHVGSALMSGVAVNPITNRVYAHIFDFQGSGLDSLTVINGATHDLISMAVLPFSNYSLPNLSGLVVNPVTNRLYVANGRETLVLEDAVVEMMPTPPAAAGESAVVTSNQASITFAGVTTGGVTQINPVAASELSVQLPGGFAIDGAQVYEVTTTASVVAPITLCFSAWHVDDPGVFATLRVLHGEDGVLIDRTTSHNFTTRSVCATVNSLSPFVIARSLAPRDTTPPNVQCATPDGLWRNTDVIIPCVASDTDSGVDVTSFNLVASLAAGAESGNVATNSQIVCDRSHNCVTVGPFAGIRIDKKSPVITITQPAQTTYTLGAIVVASYVCVDNGAGISACAAPTATGSPLNTAGVGALTFAVQARDGAGNTSAASVNYTVAYGMAVLYDQTKAVKSGSAIPIKVQLVDAAGRNVSSSTIVVKATAVKMSSSSAPGALLDTGNANPDSNFRYDAALGGYIFNLSRSGLGTGTYSFSLTAGSDPTTHVVQFQVR